jgi:hypothetical protein
VVEHLPSKIKPQDYQKEYQGEEKKESYLAYTW